jgi:hypothetical protein
MGDRTCQSVDILIGIAVVMLVLSAVTALTQFVLHVRQTKGKNLRFGVADLLQLIAPNFQPSHRDKTATGRRACASSG